MKKTFLNTQAFTAKTRRTRKKPDSLVTICLFGILRFVFLRPKISFSSRLRGELLPFFLLFFLFFSFFRPALADEKELPNFSILGQVGGGDCQGFLGTGGPSIEGGLWLGIGLNNRFDGLWGLDYYSLPGQIIPVTYGTPSNPVMAIDPTDDVSITVNTRWYWADKYDYIHGRFNTVPYFIAGLGMDFVVDQVPPRPEPFYNAGYDALFAINLGGGLDCPLGDGKQWFLYFEGMDHVIAWQGLTQIFSGRVGFKVMLDTAHVDPFR
jgi:hypothetical protein